MHLADDFLFIEDDFMILASGETYEMRNDIVVRPFKTHHVIPSQVGSSNYCLFIGPLFGLSFCLRCESVILIV